MLEPVCAGSHVTNSDGFETTFKVVDLLAAPKVPAVACAAVMRVAPAFRGVTTPVELTVATVGSLLEKENAPVLVDVGALSAKGPLTRKRVGAVKLPSTGFSKLTTGAALIPATGKR